MIRLQTSHALSGALLGLCFLGPAASAQETLLTVYGDLPGDELGGSVSGCGDVNNDGYLDFIVGTHRASFSRGLIRVYAGQTGDVLFTDTGVVPGDWLGYSVGGGADINNDGFADCVAGVPFATVNHVDQGMVRVYSGSTGNVLFQRVGDAPSDYLGLAVSTASDMDGDGFDEFIAGVPGSDAGAAETGMVRVYSGQAGAILYDLVGAPSAVTNSSVFHLGDVVCDLGDVSGDGVGDFAAGAPISDWLGKANAGIFRVYSGATGGIIYQKWGAQGDFLGTSISGVGDVDQDGRNDFVVGLPGSEGINGSTPKNCGAVRVYSGLNGSVLYNRYGDAAGDNLGVSVSGAGDFNRDNYVDFMGTSLFADAPHAADTGMVRVYSGKTGQRLYEQFGEASNRNFGSSCGEVGDSNDNGQLAIVVGESWEDTAGAMAGAAHLIGISSFRPYGDGCPGSLATPGFTISGTPTPGGQVEFSIEDGVDQSTALVLIGLAEASIPMTALCSLNAAPLVPLVLGPIPIGGAVPTGTGLADGSVGFGLPLNMPSLALYFQAFVVDPGVFGGYSNTNGVEMAVN